MSHLTDSVKSLGNTLMKREEVSKWVIVGTLIGIIAGFGAIALYFAIRFVSEYLLTGLTGFVPPASGIAGGKPGYTLGHYDVFLIPVATVIGGLLSGFIVYKFAPEAEGHGTDAAIDAFHNKNGKIRRRIPAVKLVASAITIGSGGSAGREGPTAQIAAGFGSFVADVMHLSDHDRRIAMAAGIGAGIGSIFMAPLGGALLSTEILYRQDFEVEALIPSVIASIIGYSIFGSVFGYRFLFTIPSSDVVSFSHPESLILYLIVGLLAGLGGILYVKVFYGTQKLFSRMKKVPKMLRPAIGALMVGIIAIWFPQILGLGYGWIQQIFFQSLALLPLYILIIIFFVKIIATSLTIGSGGSGGVFAPGLTIGAFMGASIWIVLHPFFPFLNIVEVTIVAMISFFGGISKAPISVLIMGTEMTGGFGLFLPLMLSTVTSYFVSGKKYSIYRAQVLNRAASPAHAGEYERPILDQISVEDAMKTDFPSASPDSSLSEAYSLINMTNTKTIVVTENGQLVGMVSLEALSSSDSPSKTPVKDVMSTNVMVIDRNSSIHEALDELTKSTIGKLVVIDKSQKDTVVGTIGFSDIADAYNREVRKLRANPV